MDRPLTGTGSLLFGGASAPMPTLSITFPPRWFQSIPILVLVGGVVGFVIGAFITVNILGYTPMQVWALATFPTAGIAAALSLMRMRSWRQFSLGNHEVTLTPSHGEPIVIPVLQVELLATERTLDLSGGEMLPCSRLILVAMGTAYSLRIGPKVVNRVFDALAQACPNAVRIPAGADARIPAMLGGWKAEDWTALMTRIVRREFNRQARKMLALALILISLGTGLFVAMVVATVRGASTPAKLWIVGIILPIIGFMALARACMLWWRGQAISRKVTAQVFRR